MHPAKTIDRRHSGIAEFVACRPLAVHASIYFVLVLMHLAVAAQMRYPTVFYDEGAYLGYARYLAGAHHSVNLAGGAGGGHFGYALLLAPAFLLASTFYYQYHLALIINSLLMSGIYFSLYFLLSRLTHLGRSPCIGIAFITCLYPSFLLFPNFVIADNAFIPIYLLVLVALYLLLDTETYWSSILFGGSAGLAYMVHNRGGSVLATAAAFVVILAICKRLPYRLSAISLALMAAFYVATDHGIAAMGAANGTPPPPASSIVHLLLNGSGFGAFLLVFIGQIVYLCQTTFCLYFAGWRMLWATDLEESPRVGSIVIGFVAVTATVIGVGAALFISTQDPFSRPDHMLIGRYNEGTLAIVLALSFALLYQAAHDAHWRRVLAWWMGGSALVLCMGTMVVGPSMHNVGMCSVNSLSNMALIGILHASDISRVSLLVLPLSAMVLLGTRRRAWAGLGLTGIFFSLSGAYVFVFWYSQRPMAPGSNPARLAPLLSKIGKATDTVSYDMSVWSPFFYSTYQLLAPEQFEQFRSDRSETPRSAMVIAGSKWKDAARLGYLFVDSETMTDNALWVNSPDLVRKAIGGKSFLGVEVGSAVVPGVFTEGVYAQEGSGPDCMRWTDGHARILVNIGRNEKAGKISMGLLAFEKTKTRLLVDGVEMMALDVGPGLVSRTLVLNPRASGRALSIGIESATFNPGPQDTRTLGVQIRSVKVLP